MPRFTRTAEEQKMLDERDQRQADHKAMVQAQTVASIVQLKEVGIVKPCQGCGQDQWVGTAMTLQGSKTEDEPVDDVMGMLTRMMSGPCSTAVLSCLVLTCGNCASMQFYNLEAFANSAEKAKAAP